jgi:hypothetical protein
MDLVHGSWTSARVAGPRVWATEARREGGDGMGTMRRDREATHPSPDDGEEAARRQWSFGREVSSSRERRRARESLRARGGGVGVAGGPWGFI